jgi:hypothetical protein
MAAIATNRDNGSPEFNDKGTDLREKARQEAYVQSELKLRQNRTAESRLKFITMAQSRTGLNQCVIFNDATGLCGLDTAQFNRALLTYVPEEITDLAPAEMEKALDEAQKKVFYGHARASYLESQSDLIWNSGKIKREILEAAEKNGSNTANAKPDPVLKRLYNEERASLFQLQENCQLEFFASTDSTLIEDVYRGQIKGASRNPNLGKPAWKPIVMAIQDVPEGLIGNLLSLRPGEWGAPFRSGFGFILPKLCIKDSKAVSGFEQLREILVRFAETWNPADTITEAEILSYYRSNKSSLSIPDSLAMEMTLRPASTVGRQAGAKPDSCEKAPCQDLYPRKIKALWVFKKSLPPELFESILRRMKVTASDSTGTFSTAFGLCSARLLSGKSNIKVPDFASTAPFIKDRLSRKKRKDAFADAATAIRSKRSAKINAILMKEILASIPVDESKLDSLLQEETVESEKIQGKTPSKTKAMVEAERNFLRIKLATQTFEENGSDWIQKNIRAPELGIR